MMPDAMIYTYAPGQPQTGTNNGAPEVVLDFAPNPKFVPPTTTAQALSGLKGRAWLDAKSRQIIRIEGTVFQPVNFGWGILAHIYPGGKLVLQQKHAGNGRWIFTHFQEDLSVRVVVKTLNLHTVVDADSFQTLPGPISYQDAVRILLDTPLPNR